MTDLCTLSDVKAWLRTGVDPFPSTDDVLLTRLITACTTAIERWASRPIGLAQWQEYRDGRGGEGPSVMVLAVTPVQSIDTLAIMNNGSWQVIPPLPGFTPFPQLPPAGQIIPPTFIGPSWAQGYTFTPTEVCVWGWRFWRGVQNVYIKYTAGYDPIPADLEQICIEAIVRKYRERQRVGLHSQSIGGIETTAYSTVTFSKHDFATDIEAYLWQFRQVAPILPATLIGPPAMPLTLEDQATVIVEEDLVTPITEETG